MSYLIRSEIKIVTESVKDIKNSISALRNLSLLVAGRGFNYNDEVTSKNISFCSTSIDEFADNVDKEIKRLSISLGVSL